MTSIQAHMTTLATAQATQPTHDESLSSTTPDVPQRSPMLPITHTLGVAAGLGVTLGALLLRSRGAGFSLGALASGGFKGVAVGAGMGAALLGIDRATNGQVKRQLDLIGLDRRAQAWFVISNPTKPWLAGLGLGVARDARAAQEALYGSSEPSDGPQDAFRHTYAAALFSLRVMRDHDIDPSEAHRLAIGAGNAHEVDGQDNNDPWSRAMDHANNTAGTHIVGDGRARAGEDADARGMLTEHALRGRVLAAIAAGEVEMIDRTGIRPSARRTNLADLPQASGG